MRKSTVACLFVGAVLVGVISVAEARVNVRAKIGGFDFFRPHSLGGTGSMGLKWGSWKTEDDPKETAYLMKLVKYAKKAQLAGKTEESRAWLNAAGNLRRLKNFQSAVVEAEAQAEKEVADELGAGNRGASIVDKTSLLEQKILSETATESSLLEQHATSEAKSVPVVESKQSSTAQDEDATHASHYHVGDQRILNNAHIGMESKAEAENKRVVSRSKGGSQQHAL